MTPPGIIGSWAAALSFLDDGLAAAIEPIARRIDLLMDQPVTSSGGVAAPNGYGGIDRRGGLDRLLLADWMIADVEPDEFARRFSEAELSYLRLDHDEPRPCGRIVALIGAGPDQIGARRLAQLAALVVLHRRADAAGLDLHLAAVTDPVDRLDTGALPELYERWAVARTPVVATREDVERWAATFEGADHLWLLGCPDAVPPRSLEFHRLRAEESGWGPEGATELMVETDRRRIRIDLPAPAAAVRLLRGDGLKRRANPAVAGSDTAIRFPRFYGAARRLLWRGIDSHQLVSATIPGAPGLDAGKPKHRRFAGPVLAAGVIGSRVVALLAVEDHLRVEVVGKRLGHVTTIDAPLSALEIDAPACEQIASEGLEPLHFDSGAILARVSGEWWRIEPPSWVLRPAGLNEVIASPTVDLPRKFQVFPERAIVDGEVLGVPSGRVVLGTRRRFASEATPGHWRVGPGSGPMMRVGDGSSVVGLTHVGSEPALLSRSKGGQLLRLERPQASTTLTAFSSDIEDLSLHPTEPILAIQRSSGAVDVIDVERGELLVHVRTAG